MKRAQRKAIWSWFFYDWAAQPYHTLLVTFIFSTYFAEAVVPDGALAQTYWGVMMGITGVVIALAAPVLGALADASGPRKPWMAGFSLLFVAGAAGLWYAVPGADNVWLILLAFGIGLFGVSLTEVFVNAIMPTLAPRDDLGPISGTGWALGYLGGVLSLIVMLTLFAETPDGTTYIGREPALGLDPTTREGTRFVGPFTAIWYLVFVLPFFFFVPDVGRRARARGAVGAALAQLLRTIRQLPKTPSLFSYLGASMFYRDALNGLYAFGGIYGAGVLGWAPTQMGVFGVIAALTGAIFAWIGGFADRAFGPRRLIAGCILCLIAVSVAIVGTGRDSFFGVALAQGSSLPDTVFYICGGVIGAAGGVLQAASRTFLVDQANPARLTEAYGLYALSGRATAFLAPGLIAAVTYVSADQRIGVSPIILLFAIGLAMLFWVKDREEHA